MVFSRILIFGQVFNKKNGGGITLTNLFNGWDKDKIAVLATGHELSDTTTDVCDIYYQLGDKEHKWIFPFNLLQRKFPSGLKQIINQADISQDQDKPTLRSTLVNKVLYPFSNWIGIFHCASKIKLSDDLKSWLSEFKPEVIYLQVSSRENILFAQELCDYLQIPSVIHIMDDWPSTIGRSGPLKFFWHPRITMELKRLFNTVDVHMSISDAMAEEYKKRYNKVFHAFHNPIDTKKWLLNTKKNYNIDPTYIKILYSGRLGTGITNSILDVASAIDSIGIESLNIKLHIQTTTRKHDIIKKLSKYKCIIINPVAEYSRIPEIFSDADILLLANDFTSKAESFLKLSMPTKASEYMVSGTPILVFAPGSVAVSKFFSINNCGHCLQSDSREDIIAAIRFLIDNKDYRKQLGRKAVSIAIERFESGNIRGVFQNILLSASRKNKDKSY
jgi:glycosyltransferase involved in cell wall biosynthesis